MSKLQSKKPQFYHTIFLYVRTHLNIYLHTLVLTILKEKGIILFDLKHVNYEDIL